MLTTNLENIQTDLEYATNVQKYLEALDDTGTTLEEYIAHLKLEEVKVINLIHEKEMADAALREHNRLDRRLKRAARRLIPYQVVRVDQTEETTKPPTEK